MKIVNMEEEDPHIFWLRWGILIKKTGLCTFSEKQIFSKSTGWDSQIDPTFLPPAVLGLKNMKKSANITIFWDLTKKVEILLDYVQSLIKCFLQD